MRKIKFRGKPTENNVSYFEKEEFAYGFLVIDNDQYYILLDVLDNIKRDDYVTYMVEIKSETIGQYTGLKDKNGKEIYEEDIIYVIPEDETAFILWDKETARYIIQLKGWCADFDNYYGKELEVIGNLLDNPESLVEKE